LECPDDCFSVVLDYHSYRLRTRGRSYGALQARKMGRTAKNMKFFFGGISLFDSTQPLLVLSWLRKFVKACDDKDMSEGMALYLFPSFLSGDAEMCLTRNLPESRTGTSRGMLSTFPEAVKWLLSTYAEPHALGLAQDQFSRAKLAENEGVDAFATRLRTLAELCGNTHSEGTMKQQLIQGLPVYLRTDAFIYNTAQRSYQQLATYVEGKYRAANYVMQLVGKAVGGLNARRGVPSLGPRGTSALVAQEVEPTCTENMVAALPSGSSGGYRGG